MSDNNEFEELVSGIKEEITRSGIESRGTAALMRVRIAGALYSEAVTAGVPHDLAKEMATDYWALEMHSGAVQVAEDGGDVE
ncbi:hypothetical protein ACFQ2B_26255 [Streptomyces stramineus]|uniref:Uncharacterized protein n=1 Tax=Streptomyces stramineus TaxID=173861 RepID=A0ABN0ZQU8_9ACTN